MIGPIEMVTIIPAKPFAESKKRLAPVLSPQERVALSQNLLGQTILAALPLGPIVVVSRSKAVQTFAGQLGAVALPEQEPTLNDAVRCGIDWLLKQGAATALILPLDLPLVSTPVLTDLARLGRTTSPGIIIAPCRRHQGTNALVLTPPTLIRPQFGPNSFARHQYLARQAGLEPIIYRAPELAFDLDTPEDWLEFTASESNQASFLTNASLKFMI